MKNLIKFSFAAIFAVILLAACSSEESNPLDPGNGGGDPDPVINTPKYMRIESIRVTNFPTTKPNGDKWDYHIFSNSPTRRPDIYVELSKTGSSSHVYRSDTKMDALLETAYQSYVFTNTASSDGGSFPYNVPMDETYIIDLIDDDGISADDWMSLVNFKPSWYYDDDNAVGFEELLTSGLFRVVIKGRWVY